MINRRLILRAGLVGAATPIVLNAVPAAAAGVDPMASGLAGSVFYTSEHPGRWAGKEGGHAPQVERSANNIEITTGHPMDCSTRRRTRRSRSTMLPASRARSTPSACATSTMSG
jgi:hypothetical protein